MLCYRIELSTCSLLDYKCAAPNTFSTDLFSQKLPLYFSQFLNDFLKYLDDWRTETQARQGFTKAQKDRLFLSSQTHEGIRTTGMMQNYSMMSYFSIYVNKIKSYFFLSSEWFHRSCKILAGA